MNIFDTNTVTEIFLAVAGDRNLMLQTLAHLAYAAPDQFADCVAYAMNDAAHMARAKASMLPAGADSLVAPF